MLVDGDELAPTRDATTVRVRGHETLVTDGPYAEVKETLGGYFVLECPTLDDAVEWAAKIPGAEHGAVEVRAVHRRSGGGTPVRYALLDPRRRHGLGRPPGRGEEAAAPGVAARVVRAVRGGREDRPEGERLRAAAARRGEGRTRAQRGDARHRRAVRRDEGGPRRRPAARAARTSTRRSGSARWSPRLAAARSRSGRCRSRERRSSGGRRIDAVGQAFREEWGRAVSILIRVLGDFELAEDAVQDAFTTAVERWPRDGVPRQPGRVDRHDRPEPRDRPFAPRAHVRREGGAAGTPARSFPPRTTT